MVEHLIDGAHQARGGESGDAQHHEAEVRNGRVGHELLQVGLHEGNQGAVDDADHGQQAQPGCCGHEGVGEERYGDAEKTVAAHLQHDRGQDHRGRGGRLHVGVGQPGVKRPHRHLDGEGQGTGGEEPGLEGGRHRPLGQERDVEGARGVVQHQEGHQHQHAAREGVEEELQRRVDAAVAAPDPDEEVHRDEHGLPEHVEEDEVEGHEDPDHARLEQEHEDHELAHPLVDVVPGPEQGEGGEEGGEQDQPVADPVDAHVVGDAVGRNPRSALEELVARGRLHAPHEKEGQGEDARAPAEAHELLGELGLLPGEGHDHRPQHRGQHQQGQEVVMEDAHDHNR